MKITLSAERRSVSVKVAVIAILILVLLIPVGMIENVVDDRMQVESIALMDIRNAWGGEQLVTGPVLRLPFRTQRTSGDGLLYTEDEVAFILADELSMSAQIDTEERHRGIHKVPVYRAQLNIAGSFDMTALRKLGIDSEAVVWTGVELLIGVADTAAINEIPVVTINGKADDFAAGAMQINGLPPQLAARVGESLGIVPGQAQLEFTMSLSVNGTSALRFLPLAKVASVTASSNWSSPSFMGRRLPAAHDVRDNGFDATWQTSGLVRSLPGHWIGYPANGEATSAAFGIRFMQPIGLYQLMLRALKYAVMFIGLSFVSYFLMETIGNLRLHPMQYLLVGLANSLFYLLLLSLAEHIGFGLAYFASAFASASLISGYSATVLATRKRAVSIALVLAALYVFLYLTLQAENFALLAGSIGLWVILAAVMYLTRRIDWYGASKADQKQALDA